MDCPEDADTYIHRVGRTARYEKSGRAVLLLDPSEEEGMIKRLEQKRVPIERINIRAKKQQSVKNQLQSMCFKDPSLKYLGQKAFSSYVRSLHIQKDKEIFKLEKYPLEEFAASLGLPGAPRIKFLKADADEVKRKKNAPRMQMALSGSEDEEQSDDDENKAKGEPSVRTKYDRMFGRQNQDILADHYARMLHDEERDDINLSRLNGVQAADDDLFDVKRRIPVEEQFDSDDEDSIPPHINSTKDANGAKAIHISGTKDPLVLDSKRREKLLKSKKKLLKLKDKGSKLVFDDEGNAHQVYELEDEEDFKARGSAADQRKKFLEEEQERVHVADRADKQVAKEKRKVRREKQKERERENDEAGGAELRGEEDAMANFLADAEGLSEDEGDELEVPKAKRQKKWFEVEGKAKRDLEEREIGTLDELEAEAARLLG